MMISRRHLAERNFRNYDCHANRVKRCPSFLDPIDDEERLVRRPPRRTPDQETTRRQKMTNAYRDNVDVAKKSGILKLPPSSADSRRMVRDLQNQSCPQMGHRESARWNGGRNLRWSEEDLERTGIGGGGRRTDAMDAMDAMDDYQDDLSHLARLKEEVRKTVLNRKTLKHGSEATMNSRPNPEVQSCPDIRFVVDEFRKHDRKQTPVRSLGSREADPHRRQPPDVMIQYPSRVDCRKHPLLVCTALRSDSQEEQFHRRVRGRSLDHYEHIPNDHRQMSVPGRSRSRARTVGGDRETVMSARPGSDWDASVSSRSRSRTRPTGAERDAVGSTGPGSYDRRVVPSVCMCGCCGVVSMESPDSRRERVLMQERWDARVWEELRSLLDAVPMTGARQPLRSQTSKSSSSDETLCGCHTSHGKTGAGGGISGRSIRDGGGALYDKMTQTEDSCRNLRTGVPLQRPRKRTPSVDRLYNRLRRSGDKALVCRSSADKGCQAATVHRNSLLDVHNCDSSITEVTSLWPSTSGSGTQDGTSGVAATAASTTDATTACQSQESLSLLQSISVELLGSSVSSECLRAAIDATTGGQPLDENSVLEAIDREMADVNQFVRETLDVSEIKPKEYLQMHMRNLQKFTSNLQEFISQQQKPISGIDSYGSPDSAFARM